MAVFPQLRNGAAAQLPLQREESYRTVLNAMADGRELRMGDAGFAGVRWTLKYAELSADEVAALRTVFEGAEGRLGTFTFVDPSANLLLWSDDLTNEVWVKGAQLGLAEVADAFGGATGARISNGSAAEETVSQTVSAPSGLTYCFSVYVRSDEACTVRLQMGGVSALTAQVTRQWRRWQAAAVGEQVEFGLSIPSMATVEVWGLQVEAQPGAGVYKRTAAAGGVFANSRFDQDVLDVSQTAVGLFGCTVRVVSRI